MVKLKAMVVDDSPQFLEKLGSFLKVGFNCEVVKKNSGAGAIDALEEQKFDIMLLDIMMPGIDGFFVLDKAMQKYPDLIVIVISGVADSAITKKAEDMGAWFMSKPVVLTALDHRLRTLLKKNKLIS